MRDRKTPKERVSEKLFAFIMMFLFLFPFVFQANIL